VMKLMYFRLAFWTVSGAYIAFIFARANGGFPTSIILTAIFFGAILGCSLGGMFVNRKTRKRS
jgi:hypothetical protein